MISLSVDVATHAHAVDLMRVLHRFHPWTLQLADGEWVVLARAERRDRVEAAMGLVSRWAADQNLGPLPFRAGADELLLRPADDMPKH